MTPDQAVLDADQAARAIITAAQEQALGKTEGFEVGRAEDRLRERLLSHQALPGLTESGPGPGEPLPDPLPVSLQQALKIGARNSQAYQMRKETVFLAALQLDLARDGFRRTFAGLLSGQAQADHASGSGEHGAVSSFEARAQQLLASGMSVSTGLALDLARLLTSGGDHAIGVLADASITVPLLAGRGREVVTEPLVQAEQDVLYALWQLQRFRKTYAVEIASEYLGVLQESDRVRNAQENHRRLATAAARARRLAEAGRLPEIDVDEAGQDELRARTRLISAQTQHASRLDRFKMTLGLPTDARIELDEAALTRLAHSVRDRLDLEAEETGPGPFEMAEAEALAIAFCERLDVRQVVAEVVDAERAVRIQADALGATADLVASGQMGERRGVGSASLGNASLRPNRGFYQVGLDVALPWERTAHRNAYRSSLLSLEQRVRAREALEDQVKQQVREALRRLREARETAAIQSRAARLAERRVANSELQLRAGRAQVRDALLAEEALLAARNALTAALRDYRVAELQVQRDLGVLEVTADGLWKEMTP